MGFEAGFSSELYEGLKATLSYTYSDFTYDEYAAVSIDLDSTGQITESSQDYSGNVVPSVPEHNFVFALQYQYRILSNLTAFIKGSYQNISGMYVNDANSDKTDGYQILNSTVGMEMFWGNFNVLLSGGVNNILDLTYVGFININSANGRFYEVGEPQSFFSTLKFNYVF